MSAILCISSSVRRGGAVVFYEIYTVDEETCKNVKNLIERLPPEQLADIAREHGGCIVESEDPLVIASRDGKIKAVAKPGNMLAMAFWGMAISLIKQQCR